MIEQTPFGYEVSCDNCSHQDMYDTDGDWAAMIKRMKEEGWRIKHRKGDFEHYCPSCVEDAKDL